MRPEQSRIIRASLGGKETIRKKRRPIDIAVLKKREIAVRLEIWMRIKSTDSNYLGQRSTIPLTFFCVANPWLAS